MCHCCFYKWKFWGKWWVSLKVSWLKASGTKVIFDLCPAWADLPEGTRMLGSSDLSQTEFVFEISVFVRSVAVTVSALKVNMTDIQQHRWRFGSWCSRFTNQRRLFRECGLEFWFVADTQMFPHILLSIWHNEMCDGKTPDCRLGFPMPLFLFLKSLLEAKSKGLLDLVKPTNNCHHSLTLAQTPQKVGF